MKKKIEYVLLILLCFFSAGGGILRAQNMLNSELLRFSLWFPYDNVPSLQKPLQAGDSVYAQAVEQIKMLTPFMLEGLVYGWKFVYTPSDKLRAVDEFFSVEPVIPVEIDEKLTFTNAGYRAESSRVECWVEYRLTENMISRRKRWQTTSFPRIKGIGSDSIVNESDGIKEACRQALKNAVRSYAQSLLKNKPKEISGTVLLVDLPRYYIKSGKYYADLDFFLFVSKIEGYTQF
ncbi:hypothetical protein H0R92_06695 [Treponema sp. OMZ 840]|uniref:hypothetical protein n=1 Tax=Treponema sp. OMZ 840 TaxID=244313 RepID=UPI003D8CEC89